DRYEQEPGLDRTISPDLPPQARTLLHAFIDTYQELPPLELARKLRQLHRIWQHEGWSLDLRAIALVLADLIDQGWWVTPNGNSIRLEPPGLMLPNETAVEAKQRMRQALQVGRNRQLEEAGTADFLRRMHRVRKFNDRRTSITDLIDDGKKLIPILRRAQ